MPAFLLPLWLFLSPMIEFWKKLPATVRNIIYILAIAFLAFQYGRHVEIQKCDARAQASIEAARNIDTKARATREKEIERQTQELKEKVLTQENQLNEYAGKFATVLEACKDADFIKRNNDIRDLGRELSNPIPGSQKRSPSR